MNKNKNYINLKLSLLIILFSMSCTNDFEEINTNEFIFNEASPEALFSGVVKNTLDLVGGTMNDQMFNTYASFYGGKGDKAHLGGFTSFDPSGVSPTLWSHMISYLGIRSLLDLGCGRGIRRPRGSTPLCPFTFQ